MTLQVFRRDDPERRIRLPRCARCGCEVERVEFDEDAAFDRLIITACCHGERERVVLGGEDLRGSIDLAPGVAFREPLRLGSAST